MTGFRGAPRRRAIGQTRRVALLGAWGLASLPAAALAVDVTLDVRDTQQYSNNETRTFQTSLRREALTVRELTRLAPRVMLEARIRALRETVGGDATGVQLESEQRTYQPALTAWYRGQSLDFGMKGSWQQRDVTGTSGLAPQSTRKQLGGWFEAELGSETTVSASLLATATEEDGANGGDTSLRQRTGTFRADRSLGQEWKAEYDLTSLSSDLVTRGSRRDEWTHALELTGSPQIVSDRLDSWFRTRTQFFRQSVEIDPVDGGVVLARPLSAAVILDDTPEVLDPLEDDGVAVTGLFDRDLDTPTTINLGDSAPVVLEFGGDYRNIVYDLGGTETLASAVLYVDARLLSPELYRWRVFVTDDPEGRVWDEVDAARATVTYREFGAVLQGWEVTFAAGVSGRYFKMVDVKLGPTVPDLFVTELEVNVRNLSDGRDSHQSTRTHEVETRLDYALTEAWDIGTAGKFEARRFTVGARDSDRWNLGLRSAYTLGDYRVHASWDAYVVSHGDRRDSDVRTYRLWGTRFRDRTFSGTASWNRTVDESSSLDRTTDTYTVSTSWRALPRLRIHHTASHGRRRDEALSVSSRSWVLTNRIESTPFRTLGVDMDHTERWVNDDAGAGFQKFRDFRLDATWTPVPLISFANTTRYQLRATRTWDTRQTLTWSPLRGSPLEPTFSGDAFHDSRVETWELGARGALRWRVRPGLIAEGFVESRRFEIAGVETSPLNTELHVSWSL